MKSQKWTSGAERTVIDVLRERAQVAPDDVFLEVTRSSFTAADLDRRTDRVANSLARLGVARGDRVAALLENCPEAILTWFAAMKLGAVVVPVNTANKGEFLRHQLADSGAQVVVVQRDLLARILRVAEGIPDVSTLVLTQADGPDDAGPFSAVQWDELESGPDGAPDVTITPRDLGTILYTAGTTGPSKGCMLSHNYLVVRSERTQWVLQRTSDDVLFSPLPLFHINAWQFGVLGALLTGGRSHLSSRFSVSGFWPEVERTGATIASLLGSMATLIARADHGDDSTSLRKVLAVPMQEETERLWRDRFDVEAFSGMYGATEASPLSVTPPGVRNKPGAAGQANTFEFDVRVFDDDDHEVAAGEVGEIVCRPRRPHVMFEGYWQRPDATVETSRNWWFHTGDLGRIDEDGFLYFVDRKADYLRRRGENVSSHEVEKLLLAHEAISDLAVHSVPSDLGEDEIKVTAVLKAGADLSEEQFCLWTVDELPFFAVPRYIEFRDGLPRSPVGRILKTQLREEGVTEGTWDREAAGIAFERR